MANSKRPRRSAWRTGLDKVLRLISQLGLVRRRFGIHPRRWITGQLAYSRYIGYIKPELLRGGEKEYAVRRQLLANAWAPRQLVAPVGRRILALSPHPDDESIGAGGLLFAHRNLAEIHLVSICDGAKGGRLDYPFQAADMAAARRLELQKTAAVLNATSVHHLDYPDGKIPIDSEAVTNLRRLVESIAPDTILLPWFLDNHIDHRRTNLLYCRSCAHLEATVLAYEIWSMLEPNGIFDISDNLQDKLDLIGNYRSQIQTVDYQGYAQGLAKVRAYHAAIRAHRDGAAEAFIVLPNREYCELARTLLSDAEQQI
jgi:LmbE family N-acetylglucosaminyl deacetylase